MPAARHVDIDGKGEKLQRGIFYLQAVKLLIEIVAPSAHDLSHEKREHDEIRRAGDAVFFVAQTAADYAQNAAENAADDGQTAFAQIKYFFPTFRRAEVVSGADTRNDIENAAEYHRQHDDPEKEFERKFHAHAPLFQQVRHEHERQEHADRDHDGIPIYIQAAYGKGDSTGRAQ